MPDLAYRVNTQVDLQSSLDDMTQAGAGNLSDLPKAKATWLRGASFACGDCADARTASLSHHFANCGCSSL